MAQDVAGHLLALAQALLNNEERSDCTVQFYKQEPSNDARKRRRDDRVWLCDPVPAHAWVLVATSERLKMQLDNWQSDQGPPSEGQASAGAASRGEGKKQKTRAGVTGTAAQQQDTGERPTGSAARPSLAVPLDDASELQPAMEVLRYMYMGALSPGLAPYTLLLVHKMAQYLLCGACVAACCAALAALASGRTATVDFDTACSVFAKPELSFALDEPALNGFVDKCWATVLCRDGTSSDNNASEPSSSSSSPALEAVMARLGDTLAVARQERLLTAFLALPAPMVVRLMGDARLKVDHENTVLLLLHHWAARNKPGSAVAKQLRNLVRPLQLSPGYLLDVLPKLPWFRLTTEEARDLNFVARFVSGSDISCRKYLDTSCLPTFKADPQWLELRCSRCGSDGNPAAEAPQATVAWDISCQQLQQHIKSASRAAVDAQNRSRALHSSTGLTSAYLDGYRWQLQLDFRREESAPATAQAVPHVGGVSRSDDQQQQRRAQCTIFMACDLPSVFLNLNIQTTTVPYKVTVAAERPGDAGPLTRTFTGCYRAGHQRGWRDFFSPLVLDVLDVSSWAALLVDGVLRLSATVSSEAAL